MASGSRGNARREEIKKGDVLVIQANAQAIDAFVGAFGLEYVGAKQHAGLLGDDLSLMGGGGA